jgi:hypothetical protein
MAMAGQSALSNTSVTAVTELSTLQYFGKRWLDQTSDVSKKPSKIETVF